MKTRLTLFLTVALVALARAGVFPPHAVVAGQTIADWTAAYNQWLFLQPTNQNPALDSDGSRATNGQAGPVFFVAGGFYSGPQPPRHYTVREDKHLLIPLITIEVDNIDTVPELSVHQMRDVAAANIDTTTELHLGIDGVDATNLFNHREISPVISFVFPSPDNLLSTFYPHPITGVVEPAVADGYWIMVEPLGVGTHTVIFGATYGSPNNYLYERTDIITVVAVTLRQRLEELMASVGESDLSTKRQRYLLTNLRRAEQRFSRGHPHRGIIQLRIFQSKVRHVLRHDPTLRDQLMQDAQATIDRAREGLGK